MLSIYLDEYETTPWDALKSGVGKSDIFWIILICIFLFTNPKFYGPNADPCLQYLIADVNYGGHVTDDCDRRLMQSYIYDSFTDEAIGKEYFKLSPLDTYVIPKVIQNSH